MLRVGINGYGTIGKRVADAIRVQPDMQVVGVAKRSPDFSAERATERGFDLYAPSGRLDVFEGATVDLVGTVEDLVSEADVIVDACPGGVGAENRPLYEAHNTPALFQGAEDPDVADVSFNARANYDEARDAEYVRVVSCNTTGLSRLVAPLDEAYGVENVRTTLIRRGGDPGQPDRGPIDDILPDPITVPSHHAPDVNTIFPDLDIHTMGVKVPATRMHLHAVNITLDSAPDRGEVRELLSEESRIFLVPGEMGLQGCGHLKELAKDAGRPRGDIWENCLWTESIHVSGTELSCFQAIHQEADVVPENVDAIRAMFGLADAEESVATTNETLGMGVRERQRAPARVEMEAEAD